jgi:hypothetical protein
MISHLWPSPRSFKPIAPITLEIGEVESFDFSLSAIQIYSILQILESCNLIKECHYKSVKEVILTIHKLLLDIDFDNDELQISEYRNIRIEFRDEMLSLEVYVGV